MTAVVGILNKHAVAIAADSAVTISGANGKKILNKANKVFTLSKYHPVGIMIYNSASFMATPWETIIKVYRKQLKNNSFPTLKRYQEDFIEFLRSKNFYTSVNIEHTFLSNFANSILKDLFHEVHQEHPNLFPNPTDVQKSQILAFLEGKFENLSAYFEQLPKCIELDSYSLNDFKAYSVDVFARLFNSNFTANGYSLSPAQEEKIKVMVFHLLKAEEEDVTSYSGLIFTGFGEDEIYPQLIPINISLVVDNRLRYYVNANSAVSIDNLFDSAIRPFAQTDVIDTILSGVAPSLNQIFLDNFGMLFQKYNDEIVRLIGTSNPQLTQLIQSLDTQLFIKEYAKINQEVKKENYINPLMGAVSSLSKEDLAEMAESLIYLTYLKRRITFAEESVGGPVDVAVISKGDGFIWIKRKHYFDPKLNRYFFDNYFNQ